VQGAVQIERGKIVTITVAQYFRDKPRSKEHGDNAVGLLAAVNSLLFEAAEDGAYDYAIDPDTGGQISGSKGGSGDGGYRLPDSETGAEGSNHKSANGVDVFDPARTLAKWCVENPDRIAAHGLWCEDFRWTPTWCHFQRVPPRSGNRIYIPSASKPLAPAP
jgi:hypothetical protein